VVESLVGAVVNRFAVRAYLVHALGLCGCDDEAVGRTLAQEEWRGDRWRSQSAATLRDVINNEPPAVMLQGVRVMLCRQNGLRAAGDKAHTEGEKQYGHGNGKNVDACHANTVVRTYVPLHSDCWQRE